MDDFTLLLDIATQSPGQINSTGEIAKRLQVSQQTISRRLRELEAQGLIARAATPKGMSVQLTTQGMERLNSAYTDLKKVFDVRGLPGSVVSGIGQGGDYVNQSGYQRQFRELLGFEAYPGTLNLKVDESAARRFLSQLETIPIHPFKTKERAFGGLAAYRVTLDHTKAAIIIPERTTHPPGIIEIIAGQYLRKKLGLKEGGSVTVGAP